MAKYLARVELHKATYDDCVALHTRMEKRGYSRTILADDGSKYHLPTGTYVTKETNSSIATALAAATEAASETGKSSSTIVVSWSADQWVGLSKV